MFEAAKPLHVHDSPPKKKYAGESDVRDGNCDAMVVQASSVNDENTIDFLSLGATIHLDVPLPHASEYTSLVLVTTGVPAHPAAAYDCTCQPPPPVRRTTSLDANTALLPVPWWLCSAQRPIATTLPVASSVGAAVPATHAELLDHVRDTIHSDARILSVTDVF
jgi:hypothetical protein